MKKILTIACALTLIASSAFAFEMLDTTGGGPGCTGIATSANSFVGYSPALTAGGYTGPAGMIMSAISSSKKATPANALYFAVRSSMDPGDDHDNSVYQLAADGTAPTQDAVDGYTIGTNFKTSAEWFVRGGSAE